jgi:hypothetical protein
MEYYKDNQSDKYRQILQEMDYSQQQEVRSSLNKIKNSENCVWINIIGYEEKLFEEVANFFGISESVLRTAMVFQEPSIEVRCCFTFNV